MTMPRKNPEDKAITRAFSMKPDISEKFNQQAKSLGLSYSQYLERLVLEKHYKGLDM